VSNLESQKTIINLYRNDLAKMKIRLMSNGLSPEMREDNIVQLLHLSVVSCVDED
jgi:hypothetical protein